MKKAIVWIFTLSLLLCGCCRKETAETAAPGTSLVPETTIVPETAAAPAESSAPTEAAAAVPPELDAFRRVLEGRMSIYREPSMEAIPISKISLFFTVEELPWTVERFAVQDLDGDGVMEAVLEVSNYMGYVILRYQEDGSVTGHEIWHRAFQNLKADGSYMGSGSSSNHSYWQFHHGGDILLAECYDNGTEMVCWVDGQKVDEAAFAAFEEEQAAKPDAIWYESWEDFLVA